MKIVLKFHSDRVEFLKKLETFKNSNNNLKKKNKSMKVYDVNSRGTFIF